LNKVGILVVGNEILDGVVLDTNSQRIINRLKPLGFQVYETMTVKDNVEAIGTAFNRLLEDGCDLVFTTGGLGPTHDDMTLQGVAEAFSLPLELNEDALAIVKRQYKEFHKRGVIDTAEITDARQKMAVLPRGATPLDNKTGGAPGVLLKRDSAYIICLPGVPKELEWIFDNITIPLLKKHVEGAFRDKIIHLPLKDESILAPIIDEVMKEAPDVYIKSMVNPYWEPGIRLWISARGQNEADVEQRVDHAAKLLVKLTQEMI
jgi:nicotinamide-nucleotide amidase